MRALIIGGAGYIGGITTRLFEEAGHQVVVLDNLSTGHTYNIKKSKLVVGDAGNKKLLAHIFINQHFDIVLDFAAKIRVDESIEKPLEYFTTNTFNLATVVDTAREYGVKNFILSSTAAVYGEPKTKNINESSPPRPINPYGLSKYLAEKILHSYEQTHGINWVALRYFNAAGAYEGIGPKYPFTTHLIARAFDTLKSKKTLPIYGTNYPTLDGSCVRDFVHVYDLATAHLEAAKKMFKNTKINRPINLGTGSGHSVLEVVATIEKHTARKLKTRRSGRRSGDPARLVASNQLAKKLLGWRPTLNLNAIISDYFDWWQNEPA